MDTGIKKYDVIYADPPWQYKVWNKKGAAGVAESHYRTLSTEFLKNMKVHSISKPDCVLLMWATFPCLEQALELGRTWGFAYKTVAFTWIKTNIVNGNICLGMGHYTRANAEIVLLFTKGRAPERKAKNIPQVVIAPRTKHSEKPDEVRKRIVRLFGEVDRVELFARQSRSEIDKNLFEGWDVFGDEAADSIELPE